MALVTFLDYLGLEVYIPRHFELVGLFDVGVKWNGELNNMNRLIGVVDCYDSCFCHFRETIPDTDSLPHHNESLWLVNNMTRPEAEKALMYKGKGTFLIRPSAQGDWACSIVYVYIYMFISV